MGKVMNEEKTLSVEEAGQRYFGISRPNAYAAVKRGEIPVIRIGRLLKVPVAAMERLMLEAGTKKVTAE
jgi:excisionase family DNA binding protein